MNSTCVQKKMDDLDKQIQLSKLSEMSYATNSKAYDALLEKNKQLQTQMDDEHKKLTGDYNSKVQTTPLWIISILYFIIMIIIYFSYKTLLTQSIVNIVSMESFSFFTCIDDEINEKMKNCLYMYRGALFIAVFITVFLINLFLFYMLLQHGKHITMAMKVISLCIFAIIGITFLVISSNVTFVKIFENTLGYAITSWFSPESNVSYLEFMNTLFIHDMYPKGGVNFDFLFSSFRLDNFGSVVKDIGHISGQKYDFHFTNDKIDEKLQTLLKMVVAKNCIGYFAWVYFSTLVCTIISIKYLVKFN